jgi:hypothetical protein
VAEQPAVRATQRRESVFWQEKSVEAVAVEDDDVSRRSVELTHEIASPREEQTSGQTD